MPKLLLFNKDARQAHSKVGRGFGSTFGIEFGNDYAANQHRRNASATARYRRRYPEPLKKWKYVSQQTGRITKHGICDTKRYYMWKGSHSHAKKNGTIWDLRLEDIPEIPDFCPVLGIPLDRESNHRKDDSPSLDRVLPELGYVPGNVRVISWRANKLKNNASLKELELLVRYVKEHIGA